MWLPSKAVCGLSFRYHYLQWSDNEHLCQQKHVGSYCVNYIEYQAICGSNQRNGKTRKVDGGSLVCFDTEII